MAKKSILTKFAVGGALLFGIFFARGAMAATLSLSPATNQIAVGQSFTVNVEVSSPDQAMNAAQGTLNFPLGILQVISVSTRNSVMTLWVQPPSFSNSDGVVNFQGVSVNPGFQGAAGQIIRVTFRANAVGSGSITFNSASVLANDGKGTNILDAMQPATITVIPAATSTGGTTAPSSVIAATSTDTTPPVPFTIKEIPDPANDPTDPRPIFQWQTTDSQSGIAKYMVRIGTGDWFNASQIQVSSSINRYELPLQAPGQNILLTVDAYDYAGNVTTATTTFSVAPIPPPQITTYSSKVIAPIQALTVKGHAPGGAVVKVYLKQTGSMNIFAFSTEADQNGNWQITQTVNASPGVWILTAQAADARGAISTEAGDLPVNVGNWFTQILSFFADWIGIILLAILLIFFGAGLVYYVKHRFELWRLNLKKELTKVREELRDDLVRLDKELDNEASGAPRAIIRKEVRHIKEDLKKDIEEIDRIEKEG